jgi:hypothetical protein
LSTIEPFNGDFDELASLMKASWSENKKEPLEYSARFLRSALLDQPGSNFDLCPSIYENGRLIAFGAGFSRTVRLPNGETCRVLLDSFITVASGHKGQGLGKAIWNGIAEVGRQKGFDGLITFCVEGDRMNDHLLQYAAECNFPTSKSMLIRYLARPVRSKDGAAEDQADVSSLQHFAPSTPLTRAWSEAEVKWQCLDRDGAFGCTLHSHGVTGTISAYKMRTAGANPVLCGLVDFIVWDNLEREEQLQMVSSLLNSAAASGVQLVLVPMLGYTSLDAFTSSGFRTTSRALQMYLTSLSGRFATDNVSSAYIEVF